MYYKNTNKISKIIECYLKINKHSEAHIKLTRILSLSILIQCQNNVFLWAWGLFLNSHCPDFPHYFSTRVHSQTPRPHGTHSMSNNAIFVCLCVCLRGLGGVYDERVSLVFNALKFENKFLSLIFIILLDIFIQSHQIQNRISSSATKPNNNK